MRCEFDSIDQGILDKMQEGRRKLDALTSLPRTGDVLIYPDGTKHRVAYSWHDALQPTVGYDVSFYVSKDGHADFSGTLGSSIPNGQFTREGYEKAWIWFFHHGHVGAHRGVSCEMEFRSWKYTPAA